MPQAKTLASTLESKTAVVDRILDLIDRQLLAYEELRMLRTRVASTGLSNELYAFLNKNAALENLFVGLPKHDGKISVESIQNDNELYYIDVAMEGLLSRIKEALKRLWNAFWDWVLDWVDDNRRLHFRLQRHKVDLENNAALYGTDDSLSRVRAMCYHYDNEWKVMHNAVVALSKLLATVTANGVEKFLNDNNKVLGDNLDVFGYSVTDAGVVSGKTMFSKMERPLGKGGANWVRSNMLSGVRMAMDMLKLEETKRAEFNNIRRAFDEAISGENDSIKLAQMAKLIRICKLTKTFAATTARACADVCRIAKANANK